MALYAGCFGLVFVFTPQEYRNYLGERKIAAIVTGSDRIDVRAAMEVLKRYGVVRVDSGGTLNSVLLNSGLVDELSVLIHPFLPEGSQIRPYSIQ